MTEKKGVSINALGWTVSLIQAGVLMIGGWNVRATISNGEKLAGIEKELALRVETADKVHSTFITKDEMYPRIESFKESLTLLTTALQKNTEQLQQIREEQIRQGLKKAS